MPPQADKETKSTPQKLEKETKSSQGSSSLQQATLEPANIASTSANLEPETSNQPSTSKGLVLKLLNYILLWMYTILFIWLCIDDTFLLIEYQNK